MIAENFNSKSVQAHYESAKKQAIAYLFTTGAKALVITDQKADDDTVEAFVGANEEAEVKKEMVHEEKVKLVKRKLSEHNTIPVYKYSRNGKLRTIHLKVKHDSHMHIFFSWKSKNNIKKHFVFTKHSTVEPLTPQQMVAPPSAHEQAIVNEAFFSSAFDQMALPFLRFKNPDRLLDIRFTTHHEMEACLEILGLSAVAVYAAITAPLGVPQRSGAASPS